MAAEAGQDRMESGRIVFGAVEEQQPRAAGRPGEERAK